MWNAIPFRKTQSSCKQLVRIGEGCVGFLSCFHNFHYRFRNIHCLHCQITSLPQFGKQHRTLGSMTRRRRTETFTGIWSLENQSVTSRGILSLPPPRVMWLSPLGLPPSSFGRAPRAPLSSAADQLGSSFQKQCKTEWHPPAPQPLPAHSPGVSELDNLEGHGLGLALGQMLCIGTA